MRDRIINEYYIWLHDRVCKNRYDKTITYNKLLTRLHDTEFIYLIPKDRNRAEAGRDLRYRFALEQGYEDRIDYILDILDGPCSMLEMLIALAIYCEEEIMDDPLIGDRTGQWFWGMINTLGLGSMIDSRYNRQYVDDTVKRLLNREYEPDGKGGLFHIRDCDRDLRTVEIAYQLYWYLGSIS